ncbi:WGR domain-containing protein [Methylolobus aquaticus]
MPPHSIAIDRWQRQRWEKDTRYYEAILQQDLWGTWVVTRVWGRRGTRLGQVRDAVFMSYEEAAKAFEAVSGRREKRGYARAPECSLMGVLSN